MNERFEILKDKLHSIVNNLFTGYHHCFEEDPEDSSVIYVNLYDVDPADVQNFKKTIRKEIRDVFKSEGILFVPAIFTTEETRTCYGQEYYRIPEMIPVLTERSKLEQIVFDQLHELEKKFTCGEDLPKRSSWNGWNSPPKIPVNEKELNADARVEERDAA